MTPGTVITEAAGDTILITAANQLAITTKPPATEMRRATIALASQAVKVAQAFTTDAAGRVGVVRGVDPGGADRQPGGQSENRGVQRQQRRAGDGAEICHPDRQCAAVVEANGTGSSGH